MKELTLDEISLLEEMKSNCLKKGQYIDDKAKDKFNMLCHLEDFSIAYYELLDIIKEVREYITSYESIETIEQVEHWENNRNLDDKTMSEMVRRYLIVHDKVLEILDKENNNGYIC